MTKTVMQHVLSRLKQVGVVDIFGVPSDHASPVNDPICNDSGIKAKTGVYIEVMTDAYASSPLALKLHDAM